MNWLASMTLACATAATACGGGGDDASAEDDSCDLTMTLTGALEAEATGTAATCNGAFGIYDPGPRLVDIHFELADSVTVGFTLVSSEGSVGPLPATFTIRAENPFRGWRTPLPNACTVDVTEHALVGDLVPGVRQYRVVGSGTCTEVAFSATPETTGTVTVGDFSLRAKLHWNAP